MADPTADNEKNKSDQGVPKRSVPANVGKLTTHDTVGEQNKSTTARQIANRFLWQPAMTIWRFPRRYWESLKDTAVSNRTIAVATVVIAIATFCTYWEARQGGKQTQTIIETAQNIQGALDTANRRNARAVRRTLEQSRNAMEASNNQSKVALDATIDQNRLDQRAFVNFGKAMQDNPIISADRPGIQGWEFRPRIGNSGNTPTRNAQMHASFDYFPTVLPADFYFPDLGEGIPNTPFMLGPKDNMTGGLLTINFPLMEAVKAKTMHLYFYGWLTYNDIFPKTPLHISMFCMELTDIRGQFTPNSDYQLLWALCPRHNCGDDECRGERYGTPSKIWR